MNMHENSPQEKAQKYLGDQSDSVCDSLDAQMGTTNTTKRK